MKISLSKLNLNENNPRFDPVASQEEALAQMITLDKERLLNLAEDIAKNGLNPTENPIIYEQSEGTYVVKDGNRRISAINAMLHAKRASQGDKKLADRLQGLRDQAYVDNLRSIRCCVFDDEDEADYWVALKHTGENEGVGTVRWNTLQQKRFKHQRTGVMTVELAAFNLAEQNAGEDLRGKIGMQFPITNLERLLDDREFRTEMGFNCDGGNLKYAKPKEEAIRNLVKIVDDLANKKKRVRAIFTHDDMMAYASELKEQGFMNPAVQPLAQAEAVIIPEATQKVVAPENVPHRRARSARQSPTERTVLIPRATVINVTNPRANNIYLELKNLNLSQFPNAVSMTFRAFIEFSAKHYTESHRVHGVGANTDLINRLKRITDHFQNSGIMTEDELLGIRTLCNEIGTQPIPITAWLNACIHNEGFHPDPETLRTQWDNIEQFLAKMWE
jgi:hypothetical protein